MAKTLLTGATGFIGAHLAHALLERGDDLRVAVRGTSAKRTVDLDAEQVKCDVLDRRSVRRAMKGVERVFHAAGVTSVRPEDASRMFDVNVGGTKIVLEEALRAGVRAGGLHLQRGRGGPRPSRRSGGRGPALHRRASRDRLRELGARGGG